MQRRIPVLTWWLDSIVLRSSSVMPMRLSAVTEILWVTSGIECLLDERKDSTRRRPGGTASISGVVWHRDGWRADGVELSDHVV